MIFAVRPLNGVFVLMAVFHSTVHAGTVSCHLHAPDNYPTFSKQPLVIPAVGNEVECEQFNRERFGSGGRCHCTMDTINPVAREAENFFPRNESPEMLP